MRRRKGRHEEHENLERWLLTYADMITLLMAFFIMMYSMSVLNMSKFRQAAISIRSGFGGVIKGQGQSAMGTSGMLGARSHSLDGDTAGVSWRIVQPLVSYIEEEANKGKVKIGEDNRGIIITLSSDDLMFKSGSSEVNPAAFPVLDRISETLKKTENLVQIEGHTCDLPPNSSRYASNWELSTARATNVLRYLVEVRHLEAERFAAAGYGSVRPVCKNKDNVSRSRNRRVEIVILRPEAAVGSAPKAESKVISNPNEAVIQRRID